MLMDFNIALLQSDFEGKLKTQESAVLGKITKIRGEESSTTRILWCSTNAFFEDLQKQIAYLSGCI